MTENKSILHNKKDVFNQALCCHLLLNSHQSHDAISICPRFLGNPSLSKSFLIYEPLLYQLQRLLYVTYALGAETTPRIYISRQLPMTRNIYHISYDSTVTEYTFRNTKPASDHFSFSPSFSHRSKSFHLSLIFEKKKTAQTFPPSLYLQYQNDAKAEKISFLKAFNLRPNSR